MSLPIEFVEKYKSLLGEEESSKFFTAINSPSKKGFRLNPLKNKYQDVQYSLKEPIEFTNDGYYGEISGAIVSGQAAMFTPKIPRPCIQPFLLM